MTCFNPLHGYKSAERTESGKRQFVMSKKSGLVDMPMTVPCGKCSGCRAVKSQEWAVRLYHELQDHERACFLTLTYDPEHYPADGKIDKRHLQLFFKRARKNGYNIRYFSCGEYGSQTHRAHYHAIIFGEDWIDGRVMLDDNLYTHPDLIRLWSNGHVSVGTVTIASIMYVARYTQKKVADTDTFTLMSRRPPIGLNWLETYKEEIIKNEAVIIEGSRFKVPRAYINRFEKDFENLKENQKLFALAQNQTSQELTSMRINHDAKTNPIKGDKL